MYFSRLNSSFPPYKCSCIEDKTKDAFVGISLKAYEYIFSSSSSFSKLKNFKIFKLNVFPKNFLDTMPSLVFLIAKNTFTEVLLYFFISLTKFSASIFFQNYHHV